MGQRTKPTPNCRLIPCRPRSPCSCFASSWSSSASAQLWSSASLQSRWFRPASPPPSAFAGLSAIGASSAASRTVRQRSPPPDRACRALQGLVGLALTDDLTGTRVRPTQGGCWNLSEIAFAAACSCRSRSGAATTLAYRGNGLSERKPYDAEAGLGNRQLCTNIGAISATAMIRSNGTGRITIPARSRRLRTAQ